MQRSRPSHVPFGVVVHSYVSRLLFRVARRELFSARICADRATTNAALLRGTLARAAAADFDPRDDLLILRSMLLMRFLSFRATGCG